jgi:hypothetical protein
MAYWMVACSVYFSLAHKRHEDLIDPYIWDTLQKATLDLLMLRRWPGFMQQADLYIPSLGVNVRICGIARASARADAPVPPLDAASIST